MPSPSDKQISNQSDHATNPHEEAARTMKPYSYEISPNANNGSHCHTCSFTVEQGIEGTNNTNQLLGTIIEELHKIYDYLSNGDVKEKHITLPIQETETMRQLVDQIKTISKDV